MADYLTTKEVAELLSVSVSRVSQLTNAGVLPYSKLSGNGKKAGRLYSYEDVNNYMKKKGNDPTIIKSWKNIYNTFTDIQKDDLDLILNLLDKAFEGRTDQQKRFLKKACESVIDAVA